MERTVTDLKLEPLMDRNIFELSGGEKQQIACGSVYAAEPQIYVLDEPSSNLDKKAVNRIHDIFARMKANGNTLVISEHRIPYLMDIADRFIYLDDGIITGEYTADEMRAMSDETLAEMGLRCTDIRHIPTNQQNDQLQNSAAALDVIDLSCSRGNSRILDIDRILLPEHSIVAVVGDNGCGKSTLAEALCGLIPSDGSVALGGRFLNDRQRQQQCYMVMQDVNRQLFSDSVIEEVMLRLFVMSLIAFVFWKLFFRREANPPVGVIIAANIVAALLFAASHLPSTMQMFGEITPMVLFRCFLLNGAAGLAFGFLYRRYGIQYAMAAHAGAHIVWKIIWIIFL